MGENRVTAVLELHALTVRFATPEGEVSAVSELDLLVVEDVGRLVRGVEAVRIWGIAVDHGTRCIAPRKN